MSAFKQLTVNQLKLELSKRGASVSGRKSVLVDRLDAYERNDDFKNVIVVPETTSVDWPRTGYRQILPLDAEHLPPLTTDKIKSYFGFHQKVVIIDIKDNKSLSKGDLLLGGGRIDACSLLRCSGGDTFFSGMVSAAMKKKVSYSYRIKLDVEGTIKNTNCECPAGKGLHGTCKHIGCVLMMIVEFLKTGELQIKQSCTETLQTFHHPQKRHQGLPVKIEDMPRNVTVDMSDPRPLKYRRMPNYNAHVRTTVLQYCCSTSSDIGLKYLYKGADLNAAAHDHAYLSLPFTEYWVDAENEKTACQAEKILTETEDQSNSNLWHKERQWRVTASRFGEVCRATDRRDMTKLCKSILEDRKIFSHSIAHGKEYEAKAIETFSAMLGVHVKKSGLHICKEKPFLAASPDGIVDTSLVEVKCPYNGRYSKITANENFPFLKFVDGKLSLKRSHPYFDQIQGQMYVCKFSTCYFIVYTFEELFVETVAYDDNYCSQYLVPKLQHFYSTWYRPFVAKQL